MFKVKNNIVVVGVVYPEVECYLDDYFDSLQNQNYKEFDILIFNDGMNKALMNSYIEKYPYLNIIEKEVLNLQTPAQIREYAIFYLKDRYDYLIFTDSDDYYSCDRIEKSLIKLYDFDFCYNEIILVDHNRKEIGNKTYFANKDNPILVNYYYQLLDRNFCGLSNTAINLKTINLNFLRIPSDIVAVDWWIFSLLVIKGYKGCFIKDTYSYYRQYEANIVGGLNDIDEKSILRGIYVKKMHYIRLLMLYPSIFNYSINKELESLLKLEIIVEDPINMKRFIDYINRTYKEYMWWEAIKLDKGVGKLDGNYKNRG